MVRPPKNSATPNACTRIKNVLWELLLAGDVRYLTVERVLRLAKVNRTTFYYHFANLADAQKELEAEKLTADRYEEMVRALASIGSDDSLSQFYRRNQDVLLYVSYHLRSGDIETRERFTSIMRTCWVENGFLPDGALTDAQETTFNFVVGGIAQNIATLPTMSPRQRTQRMESLAVAAQNPDCARIRATLNTVLSVRKNEH